MHEQTLQKKVLVVGLGKTGLSVARYLARLGLNVAVTDSRATPPGLEALREDLPDVALFLGEFREEVFLNADELVVSPGISLKHPLVQQARQRGIAITGDIELFARAAHAPVAAITGSNGKSTVTSLLGMMAREAGRDVRVGGNLGTPALDLLGERDPDLYVLELSSFQLEYTESLQAAAAVVLNLSEDHMDRYDSLPEYAAAKQRIYRGQGVMVLNRDDPLVMAMREEGRTVLSFGLDRPPAGQYGVAEFDGEPCLCRGDEALLPVSQLPIPGRHNQANALAALCLGEGLGLEREAMLRALRGFQGLPHRTQFVAEVDGVRYYNDSKGTNVGASQAALAGLAGKVVLIAGGEGKGADFSVMRELVREKARAVVLIGRDANLIAQAWQGAADLHAAKDMADAVRTARLLAHPGDSVLLSPACASFDMFDNYQHRGEVFMQIVRGLT